MRQGIPRVLIAYVITAFGLTYLVFYVLSPYFERLLSNTSLNQQSSLYYFLSAIPQYLIYALATLVFYWLVVRPLKLQPVVGQASGSVRLTVLCLCIGLSYVCVSPFNIMFTVKNGLGILTFLITGLSEEWIYRGVIIRVFKERVGIIWAIVMSAVLFALFHWGEVFIHAQNSSLKADFIGLGQDLLFGLVFGVVVWRSHSILWAAFLHCINDWQPYMAPGRHWMLDWHLPWLSMGSLQIYAIGIVGAEIIRLCSKRDVKKIDGFEKLTATYQ